MFEDFVHFVQDLYKTKDTVPLHEPSFLGKEKEYLLETIDSSFVSSVGPFVDKFEQKVAEYTGAKYAIATVNGTAALHVALLLAGVTAGDEVITQSLTFVATCNAIRYCNAEPVFVDINRDTLGLDPESLESFLSENTLVSDDDTCINKNTGRTIRACVPMHTFGHPVHLDKIRRICDTYKLTLVEDAAEALGSLHKKRHVGTIGDVSALSFNGNKIITTGGGGMILTNNSEYAARAKHLTTTAKIPHTWAYEHDETAFNYRLPNLNAALGCAQMEQLDFFIGKKRELAERYRDWCANHGVEYVEEPPDSRSNYWLNTLLLESQEQRDALLAYSNSNNIMTRPAWTPMHRLSMNRQCQSYNLSNTENLSDRLINVPSSFISNA